MDSTIIDRFPHPVLQTLHEQPTYQQLKAINLQLNANAASIRTTLGDLGLLALTIPKAAYNKLTKTKFITPTNPGAFPSADLPPEIIKITIQQYNLQLAEWKAFTATDSVLKQMLLGAVPDVYTSALKHLSTDYDFANKLQILTHMYSEFGKIHPRPSARTTKK